MWGAYWVVHLWQRGTRSLSRLEQFPRPGHRHPHPQSSAEQPHTKRNRTEVQIWYRRYCTASWCTEGHETAEKGMRLTDFSSLFLSLGSCCHHGKFNAVLDPPKTANGDVIYKYTGGWMDGWTYRRAVLCGCKIKKRLQCYSLLFHVVGGMESTVPFWYSSRVGSSPCQPARRTCRSTQRWEHIRDQLKKIQAWTEVLKYSLV